MGEPKIVAFEVMQNKDKKTGEFNIQAAEGEKYYLSHIVTIEGKAKDILTTKPLSRQPMHGPAYIRDIIVHQGENKGNDIVYPFYDLDRLQPYGRGEYKKQKNKLLGKRIWKAIKQLKINGNTDAENNGVRASSSINNILGILENLPKNRPFIRWLVAGTALTTIGYETLIKNHNISIPQPAAASSQAANSIAATPHKVLNIHHHRHHHHPS